MSTANKILMGAAGAGVELPSDDEFNRVSFLSHFDGENNGVNNVFDDGSASNHTITANGNVTQGSFGPFARPDGEWGVSFDGTGDYVHTPESAYSNTGSFTAEAWVYTTVTDTGTERRQHIIAQQKDNDASRSNFNLHIVYATQIVFVVFSASGDKSADVSSNTGLSPNTWTHIAGSFDGSNLRLFVNGVLKDTTASTNAPRNTTQPVAVGARTTNNDGTSGTEFFQGYISNARLTKSAVYTSAFTPSTSSLTAITNTSLLTCQSNRFVDNSASGHTITPSGNTAVTAFGPILSSRVYNPAVNGASAYFDGTADALSVASSPISASGNFTLEGWVYSNSASEQAIVGQYQGRSTGRMIITTGSGLLIFFQNGVTGGNNGSSVALGQWAHFVLQRTGSNIAFYVNGSRVLNNSAGNIAQDYLVIGTEDVNSGNYPNTFDGYISNIRCTASAVYSEGTSITVPTAPYSTVTNTNLLLNMADGQAIDSAAQNNLSLGGNANISTDQAKFGNTSLHLAGSTGDFADIIDPKTIGKGDFTIEGFYRFASFNNQQNLFDFRTAADSALPMLYFNNGSNELIYYVSAGARITYSIDFALNTFYHVALCRSGTSTKLFVNGTQGGSTYSDSTSYVSTPNCRIGAASYNTGSVPLNGFCDDFRISHMARYTSNFTAPAEPFADKGQ